MGMLGAGLLTALGVMAVAVGAGRTSSMDAAVDGWLRPHLTPVVRTAASDLHAYIGQPVHFATVVVFCGLLISLHTRSLLPVPLLTGAVGVGAVVEDSLKAVLAPYGFPSGHVTVTAAFLGTVAVCLGRRRGRAAHALLAALASTGVAIVAVNTLVSGAHTITEAIGGMVLGGSLVAAGASAQRAAVPARRAAVAVSAHTTPMRSADILFGRG